MPPSRMGSANCGLTESSRAESVVAPNLGSLSEAVPAAMGVHSPAERSETNDHLRKSSNGRNHPSASILIMIRGRTCLWLIGERQSDRA
jgi:hypothetical protein